MDYICIAFVCVGGADQAAAWIRGVPSEGPGDPAAVLLFNRPEIKEARAVQRSGFDPSFLALLRPASCREEGLPGI